ncbi:hypothetical protein BT69DRAFT_1332618 [Atractiella rhizophila]|nr:hypothetical protein BT69DRAFT_1332618 [Atractiella rhizophila]
MAKPNVSVSQITLNADSESASEEESDITGIGKIAGGQGGHGGSGAAESADAKKKAVCARRLTISLSFSLDVGDNCRKSKCKCTRDIDPETKLPVGACQNCMAVGTECTFLGASRKRGPPKGYIEAIESRLHRMEALLGGLLQNDDPRAQALLGELIGDDEARDILARDLKTATTSKRARKSWKPAPSPIPETLGEGSNGKRRKPSVAPSFSTFKTEALVGSTPIGGGDPNLFPYPQPPSHPHPHSGSHLSNTGMQHGWDPSVGVNPEWTTGISAGIGGTLNGSVNSLGFVGGMQGGQWANGAFAGSSPEQGGGGGMEMDLGINPALTGMQSMVGEGGSPASNDSGNARQKRRLNTNGPGGSPNLTMTSPFVANNNSLPHSHPTHPQSSPALSRTVLFGPQPNPDAPGSIPHTGSASYSLSKAAMDAAAAAGDPDESGMVVMNELSDVVGQLSLNENAEVRYHGRSSGLYLISKSSRYRDFFWQFPSTGFWPPSEGKVVKTEEEILVEAQATDCLPDRPTQDHLLDLYMTYVHPHYPLLYKPHILRQYRAWATSQSGGATPSNIGKIPTLLLLCIFALASRYSDSDAPRKDGKYWTAGEEYYNAAKRILNQEYGSTKLVTVQALLLLAYRQIGIGAMSESWLYVGMAVRMSQDLGLFRDVDKWFMPVNKFSYEEKQTRKRVWWACLILDKYVATYIGRPMAIFERDYDTALPNEDEPDEHEQWRPLRPDGTDWDDPPKRDPGYEEDAKPRAPYPPTKSHSISCFNASGQLATLVSRIIVNIYAIRTRVLGQSSANLLSFFDQNLANWFLNLPPHLSFNPTSKKVPPPHVLCLHAQFYCSLILLHRPFIPGQTVPHKGPTTALPSHSICTTSANAISNIVSIFQKTFTLRQCPPFMTYPIFTAAIMHVYNTTYDPALASTAKVNLQKCMDALKAMELTWGSAIRAWELLSGLVDMRDTWDGKARPGESRGTKRGAEDETAMGDGDFARQTTFHTRPGPRRSNSTSRRRASRSSQNPAGHFRSGSNDSRPQNGGFVFPDSPFTYDVSLPSTMMPPPMMQQRQAAPAAEGFRAHQIRTASGTGAVTPQTFEILGIDSAAVKNGDPSTYGRGVAAPSPSFSELLNNFSASSPVGGANAFASQPFDQNSAFFGLPLGGYLTEEWAAYLPQAFLSPVPRPEDGAYSFVPEGSSGTSIGEGGSQQVDVPVEQVTSPQVDGNNMNTS